VTASTSNKQLAFVEHIYRALRPDGRAAVIVPDNVLFDDSTAQKLRQQLMDWCNLHTVLRLPLGIFYAQGVNTNVLFFCRNAAAKKNTSKVWVYDMRSNMPAFGRTRTLLPSDFADFEMCFGPDPNGKSPRVDQGEKGRFRCFSREEIADDGDRLDKTWLREDKNDLEDKLVEPADIAAAILQHLRNACDEIDAYSEAIVCNSDNKSPSPCEGVRDWTMSQLGDAGIWTGGGTPNKSVARYWSNGNIPWISPKDMKVQYIGGGADYITEEALGSSAAKLIDPNSILVVVRSGILAHSLPVAINTVPVAVNQDMKCLTPSNEFDAEYIMFYLISRAQEVLEKCSKSGTTVASVDYDKLKAFPIPKPSLEEQKRIVQTIKKASAAFAFIRTQHESVGQLMERLSAATLYNSLSGGMFMAETDNDKTD
jgi:hypothetical protein